MKFQQLPNSIFLVREDLQDLLSAVGFAEKILMQDPESEPV